MVEESIKVAVRCRPFNQREKDQKEPSIVTVDPANASVKIVNPEKPSEAPQQFTYDFSYDESCKQIDVYNKTASALVDNVLQGFNATIFAYGQTGTGKSFSMEGIRSVPELRGIIPNSFNQIFEYADKKKDKQQVLVRCSYLEIYNEEVRDLLSNTPQQPLELKENPTKGVFVKDLQEFVVKNPEEMNKLMDKGLANRSVGETAMNATSSRSHSIFSITVESCDILDDRGLIKAGKLNLVDLAGSERQSKTGAQGQRLKEAAKINLSLSSLGNVISALVEGRAHVPYRDSKLTRLLQDSLGGNAKTLMMATLSPAGYNFEETLSTLRYATRTKCIKNKPIINEDPKDSLLRQYRDQIKTLRVQLALSRWNKAKDSAIKFGGGTKVSPLTLSITNGADNAAGAIDFTLLPSQITATSADAPETAGSNATDSIQRPSEMQVSTPASVESPAVLQSDAFVHSDDNSPLLQQVRKSQSGNTIRTDAAATKTPSANNLNGVSNEQVRASTTISNGKMDRNSSAKGIKSMDQLTATLPGYNEQVAPIPVPLEQVILMQKHLAELDLNRFIAENANVKIYDAEHYVVPDLKNLPSFHPGYNDKELEYREYRRMKRNIFMKCFGLIAIVFIACGIVFAIGLGSGNAIPRDSFRGKKWLDWADANGFMHPEDLESWVTETYGSSIMLKREPLPAPTEGQQPPPPPPQ